MHRPSLRTAHLAAPLAVALLALGPRPAAAQEAGTTEWAQPEASSPAPEEPGPTVAAFRPVPRPDGLLTVEALLGAGGTGGGGGLRVSFGLESAAGWRFELGGGGIVESGQGGLEGRYDLVRAFVEVSVARRFGRVEPWAAVGMTNFTVERSGAGSGEDSHCLPLTSLCLTGGGGGPDGDHAPSLAAGLRLAITNTLLAGFAVRKAVATRGPLAGLPGQADPTAPWVGLSLAWRPGSGR